MTRKITTLEWLQTRTPERQNPFVDVMAIADIRDGSSVEVWVPGTIFSSYKTGPELGKLADLVQELLPDQAIAGVELAHCGVPLRPAS